MVNFINPQISNEIKLEPQLQYYMPEIPHSGVSLGTFSNIKYPISMPLINIQMEIPLIKIERKIERPLKIVDKKVNCNIIEMVKDRYYDIEYKNKKYLFKKTSERVIDIYEVLE